MQQLNFLLSLVTAECVLDFELADVARTVVLPLGYWLAKCSLYISNWAARVEKEKLIEP